MNECRNNSMMDTGNNTMNNTRNGNMNNARNCSNENTTSKEALLQHINEVSFAAYDTMLYLDTHHCDQAAMEYFREMMKKRKEAMAEYGRMYGPLTVDCDSATADDHWQWAHQPWPWEGGKH